MPILIHPCTHLSSCEPCCPLYDGRALADLDATVDMTLVVVTRSSPRRRYTYALPPNSDAIFLTESAKERFLWPVLSKEKQQEWPKGYDPRKHGPLNSNVLLEL